MHYLLRTPADNGVAFAYFRNWIFKRVTNPDRTTVWFCATDLAVSREERYEKYLELSGEDRKDGVHWRPHDWMELGALDYSYEPNNSPPGQNSADPETQSEKLFLLTLAEAGDERALLHPEVATRRDYWGNTPLHELARNGCLAILGHSLVASIRNNRGDTPLHELAEAGHREVLTHPEVATVYGYLGETPLHRLVAYCHLKAKRKELETIRGILAHPMAGVARDHSGDTPLHHLARLGLGDCRSHPLFDVLRNNDGKTPSELWGTWHNEKRWRHFEERSLSHDEAAVANNSQEL